MENLTVAQVVGAFALIIAISAGGKKLWDAFKQTITNIVAETVKPLSESIDKVDMAATKNFLVRCLSDLERGNEMGEIEKQRFKEQYDHYIDKGGNTYIKDEVERLKAEGKL